MNYREREVERFYIAAGQLFVFILSCAYICKVVKFKRFLQYINLKTTLIFCGSVLSIILLSNLL